MVEKYLYARGCARRVAQARETLFPGIEASADGLTWFLIEPNRTASMNCWQKKWFVEYARMFSLTNWSDEEGGVFCFVIFQGRLQAVH